MRTPTLLALFCSLALTACGDSAATLDTGYEALRDGDHAGAVTAFDSVLAGLEKGTPEFKQACMGRIQALAHVDAEKAKETFMAEAAGGGMTAKDYGDVVTELYAANNHGVAIAVLDAGKKALPDDPQINQMLEKAKADADKNPEGAAAKALSGLGYLGGE